MANSSSGDSAVDRLIRVLETFTPTRTVQTTSEIGRRAGLPSSSAHRIVGDLITAGLLERDDAHRVRIGTRLWELATRSSGAVRLRQIAMPFMERVHAQVREHTQLAVLEQDEALFLERLSSPTSGANITRIAGRLPLHACSSGLALLAFGTPDLRERVLAASLTPLTSGTITDLDALRRKLDDIRTLRQVIAPGYVEDVSTGVAVPVLDHTGHAVAALSVVLPREAPTEDALAALHAAARGMENALRTDGFRP